MATKKKNKKKPAPKPSGQTMTPKQYFLAGRPRLLELYECVVNDDYKESGMAIVLIARQHKTGNITFSSFIVDIFCLGVKDTNSAFNRTEEEYVDYKDQVFSHGPEIPISYDLAHNIVFGAIEYAKKLGFSPHKDWETAQFMLESKTSPKVEKMDLDFGKDGKPFYITGPHDRVQYVIDKLDKAVGKDNYEVLLNMGHGGFGFDDLEFLEEDEDEENEDEENEDEENEDDETETDTGFTDYEEVK
jgi:hypothetical protein